MEEAVQLCENSPRKILVDIYTNWCGWCKKMDKNTFTDDKLVAYINDHYYAVKFNAEQKEDILFKGKVYKYIRKNKRGYHEFAANLLQGKMSFPSFVFLDESQGIIQPISNYIEAPKFLMISSYFAEDYYKTTPWTQYAKKYRKKHGIIK